MRRLLFPLLLALAMPVFSADRPDGLQPLPEAPPPPPGVNLDEPAEVVAAIFHYYEKRGFERLPEEHELMLNL